MLAVRVPSLVVIDLNGHEGSDERVGRHDDGTDDQDSQHGCTDGANPVRGGPQTLDAHRRNQHTTPPALSCMPLPYRGSMSSPGQNPAHPPVRVIKLPAK